MASKHQSHHLAAQFQELPDAAFVRMDTIQAVFGGAPRTTIERWIREGHFPRGIAVNRWRAWQVGELRNFLANSGK